MNRKIDVKEIKALMADFLEVIEHWEKEEWEINFLSEILFQLKYLDSIAIKDIIKNMKRIYFGYKE